MPHYPYLPTSPPRIKKGNIWLSLWGRERELVDHENRKKGKKNLSRAVQETIVVDAISGGGNFKLVKNTRRCTHIYQQPQHQCSRCGLPDEARTVCTVLVKPIFYSNNRNRLITANHCGRSQGRLLLPPNVHIITWRQCSTKPHTRARTHTLQKLYILGNNQMKTPLCC